jgi:hypothetical protein
MAMFAHRHSYSIAQFNAVMSAMRGAPDLVELGKDGRGEDRFTTSQMIEAEQRLHHAAELMAERERSRCRAWRGRPGKRRAIRSGVLRCRVSRQKISNTDRGSPRAPSPVWSTAGDRAAIC